MFEDMLIDEKIKTKRGRTTVLSFALQICLVAVVVILPLLFTQALPTPALTTMLVAPPPPPPPPPPAAAAHAAPRHVEPQTPVKSEMEVPVKIPQKVAMVHENLPQSDQVADAAPAVGGVVGGVPGGVQGGTVGGVVGGVLNSVGTAMPKLAPNRVRVSSGVTEGLLLHQVKPQYPPAARSAGVQGAVVLHAIIGKDGKVKNVQVVSGPPMLASAAESAVKQWQYKPYVLNGQPVEIDTNITVNFKLG